jgi:hypothetical protein
MRRTHWTGSTSENRGRISGQYIRRWIVDAASIGSDRLNLQEYPQSNRQEIVNTCVCGFATTSSMSSLLATS